MANVHRTLRAFAIFRPCASHTALRNFYTYSPEPSQPIPNQEPKWVNSAQDAFECLQSNSTVYVHGGTATPLELIKGMTDQGKACNLKNIQVCHLHTEGDAPYTHPECEGIFRASSLFLGENVRKPTAEGRSDFIPVFLSEVPSLFFKKILQPDISLIHVSPPDKHGYCSLGTSVDCTRAAVSHSKIIIAQVNPRMPRTFGDATIHSSHFDYALRVDAKLFDHDEYTGSPEEVKIGQLIADNLVVNGATLQTGIGSIPEAVLAMLTGHKDLGIHSELVFNGIIPLIEKGLVTNNKKSIHQGKTICSIMSGNRKFYDYVDDNPSIEMLVSNHVNSTEIIMQQPNMTAINSCIEVDLTGQVVSDSIGTRMYSGFGGQVDFIRGAAMARDGKGVPIIALTSTTSKGESKISPCVKLGAGVTTSRAHVHYVVTENGIAQLFGKTLSQRAHALINIAHPEHRESLEKAAFQRLKTMPKE